MISDSVLAILVISGISALLSVIQTYILLRQLNPEFVADRAIRRTEGGSEDDSISTTIHCGREGDCSVTTLGGQSARVRSL